MAAETEHNSEDGEIDFVSLGMFIIDQIDFRAPTPSVYNVIGGAGTYSAIGARIMSPGSLSKRVGWIVDAGSDFPPELRQLIASWNTGCLLRETPERLTTRGWNGYGENEHRGWSWPAHFRQPLNGPIAFKYTTPKLRLDHNSPDSKLLSSKSFHLICGPARCVELVSGIMRRREQLRISTAKDHRPVFVWEPVPDMCQPSELQACFEALQHVDMVSPNHAELCGFFAEEPHDGNGNIASHTIEKCCKALLASPKNETTHLRAVIVRAGKDGCVVATTGTTAWLPAYHQQASRVIDATGGGNTFLGGFTISLARAGGFELKDIRKAVIDGAVSASFAIEQVGMPVLTSHRDMRESWNDDSVQARVAELSKRTPVL